MAAKKKFEKIFEGYEEQFVQGENGKTKTVMVYVGPYYTCPLSKNKWLIHKIITATLLVISLFFTILSSFANVEMNLAKLHSLFVSLCVIMGMVIIVFLFYYAPAPLRMNLHQHKAAVIRFRIALAINWLVTAATFLSSVVYTIALGKASQIVYWFCVWCYLFAAVIQFFVWFFERKAEFKIES